MNIGSISHGTMLPEDVIPALMDELASQKPCRKEHKKLLREIRRSMTELKDNYFESEDAMHDCESLFDALNEYAPPYFYFGAHPGNDSDYGYWLSEYWEESFDGLKVSDTSDIPRGYTGEVLYVNDHGNATLYRVVRGRRYEIWSIV